MSEHSQGKERPALPRSKDLAIVPAPERSRNHGEGGRFVPGNAAGRGKGWKAALRKMLGRETADAIATVVAEDAFKIFAATIREMPSDGVLVRGLVAQKARHDALAAFWTAKSVDAGISTPEGIAAADHATKHGTRAERLAVTALDVATKLAKQPRRDASDAPWLEADEETTT